MRMVDLIQKKRDGGCLSDAEIDFLVKGITDGDIPDYQISAWAMAVYFNSMTREETASLTMAMARSGDQIDLSGIEGITVDKHSTGGVGDTTTLVLAPLVASAGAHVAKMSGRGLGHTGGTIDKLESIPGFHVELAQSQFIRQVNELGIALTSQTGNITPADKKLYSLRDVTATVSSIPLIASSVMSKKIASGADRICLDVKTGKGAFMKSLDEAISLAQAMVEIGDAVDRETVAVITSMEEPLGLAVGNALEVKEAILTLQGKGPRDLTELCLTLGAHMLVLSQHAESIAEGRNRLQACIDDGSALEKLKQFVIAQGGDATVIDQPDLLPQAAHVVKVQAAKSGFVTSIDAEKIGLGAMRIGAGRATKESDIDPAAGILLNKKTGDAVAKGDTLAELHISSHFIEASKSVQQEVQQAFNIDQRYSQKQALVLATVTKDGVEKY